MGLRSYRLKLEAKAERKEKKAVIQRYRKYRQTLANMRDALMVEAKSGSLENPGINAAAHLNAAMFEIDVFLGHYIEEG